jgi:hypothetical protein
MIEKRVEKHIEISESSNNIASGYHGDDPQE